MIDYEEKLDYDRFHFSIWNHHISLEEVSLRFREYNSNLLDELTYLHFREGLRSNLSDEIMARLILNNIKILIRNVSECLS